jgi:hypothetical protein
VLSRLEFLSLRHWEYRKEDAAAITHLTNLRNLKVASQPNICNQFRFAGRYVSGLITVELPLAGE